MTAAQNLPGGLPLPAFLELPVNNDHDSIVFNIQRNAKRGLPELTQHEWRERLVMVVAGGPSLKEYLPVIKAYRGSCDVLSVNGAYKFLRSHGIESDHFVLIDSRAENVLHVQDASYETNHCLASQVHPRVLDELEGRKVTLFHLGTQTARDAIPGKFKFLTAPIGMASVHAVYVAAALGYKTQMLFGYDFSRKSEPYAFRQPLNDSDEEIDVTLDGMTYKTTLALARTAEQFVRAISPVMKQCELDIRLYSDGLLPAMIEKANQENDEESERAKYEQMWTIDLYRKVSPGLWYVDEAITALGAVEGSTFCDFGCGTGAACSELAARGFRAHGVDIADNCINAVGPWLFTRAALWDAEKLPKVDYGFSVDVLEHIPTPKLLDTLHAIHDACAKGVYLNIDTIHDSFGAMIGQSLHLTVMSADEWEKVLLSVWPSVTRLESNERQAAFVCRRDHA